MGRQAASFTQRDLTRAVKGTVAGGLDVVRVDVQPDGTISIITNRQDAGGKSDLSEFDKWKAKKHARTS